VPTIRRDASKAQEQAPFGVYDGPEPPDGIYHAVIKSVRLKKSKNDNPYLNILPELQAPDDSPKGVYDGFAGWTMVTLDGSEVNASRERSLYMAVAGKPVVDIVTDDAKPDPNVTKIGGKSPVDVHVLVKLKHDDYGVKGDWIYADGKPAEAAPDPDDEDESVEAEAKTNVTPMRRTRKAAAKAAEPAKSETPDDYHAMTLPQLRTFAKGQDIDVSGKGKKAILEELDAKLQAATAETQKNPQDIKAMSEDELITFLDEVDYDADDFGRKNGKLDRDEIIEILADDGIILPF
jgi:hypothetical protein